MDERIIPGVLTLLLVVVVFALMGWGWHNKLKRQGGVAELPEVPAELGEPLISVPGQYVVTTSAGDWLDRLAVHGLGIRTPAVIHVHPTGILVQRSGAQDIYIAQEQFTELSTQAGMAGKFVEKDGLVVISWLLDGTAVDTGFRTTEAGAKAPLMETLSSLLPVGAGMAENGMEETAKDVKTIDTPEFEIPEVERNGKNDSE